MVAVARCCQLVAPAAKGACVACTKISESVGVVLSAAALEVSCCAAEETSAALEVEEAVEAEAAAVASAATSEEAVAVVVVVDGVLSDCAQRVAGSTGTTVEMEPSGSVSKRIGM